MLIKYSSKVHFDFKILYIDHIQLFELYNGLIKAQWNNRDFGLEGSIKSIEEKYSEILKHNEDYLKIEKTFNFEQDKVVQSNQTYDV